MMDHISTDNPELDALFERLRQAPGSHVFAPLADACRKAGMISEAIEIVDKGIGANPDYPSGFVVRGKCYFDSGDQEQAQVAFERVLELDPNNLVALKYLGIMAADRGDVEGAREHFKQILILDPDDRGVRENLDLVPVRQPGEATEERSVEEDEDFEGSTITLGDPDETTDELATTTLADIYAAQGYTGKAVRIYREVLARQPDNEEVRQKILHLADEAAPAATARRSETVTKPLADDEPTEAQAAPAATTTRGSESVIELPADDEPAPAATEARGSESVIELPADDEPAFEEVPQDGKPRVRSSRRGRPAPQPEPREEPPPSKPIEEGRSYEQFKRWLKNIAD